MKRSFPFELFDSHLHRQWKRDRAIRSRVPMRHTWRGCLGLAALLDHVDDTFYHGDKCLIENDHVTWLALRDVPAGHWQFADGRQRDVNFANTTRATLRYGLPHIDFTAGSPGWDFRKMPFSSFVRPLQNHGRGQELVEATGDTLHTGRYEREFAVLNELSRRMTDYALNGMGHDGRPARPQWSHLRSSQNAKRFCLPEPERWFPVPYLAFPREVAHLLYPAMINPTSRSNTFICPDCNSTVESSQLRGPDRLVEFCEDGDFIASCPRCGQERKWHLDDGVATAFKRVFTLPFQRRFCDAVARGLTLSATEPSVYCSVETIRRTADQPDVMGGNRRTMDLVPHRLRSLIDGTVRTLHLPRSCELLVKPGQVLAGAEVWCRAIPQPPASWRQRDLRRRWASLHEVCGGSQYVRHLQRLWFEQQAVRMIERPQIILFRADLVAPACRAVPPVGLWWDLQPAYLHVEGVLEAAIFLSIPLHGWEQLRLNPCELPLDARIPGGRLLQQRPMLEAAPSAVKNLGGQTELVTPDYVAA